ncbi:hypothetical protein IAE22_29035 [Bacillus sp. S34]|nr:hypothetical protein [Bacillus sp. S34]
MHDGRVTEYIGVDLAWGLGTDRKPAMTPLPATRTATTGPDCMNSTIAWPTVRRRVG